MPKGYPLGLTPAVLEGLGGEEGVQVDAELAAEATDGADVKVYFLEGFGPTLEFSSESLAPGRDPLGPQGLLDLRFQRSGFPAGHLNLVEKLPAFAGVLLKPGSPSIHDAVLDLARTVDQVNKTGAGLVVAANVAVRAALTSDAVTSHCWPFASTGGTFPVKHFSRSCDIFG